MLSCASPSSRSVTTTAAAALAAVAATLWWVRSHRCRRDDPTKGTLVPCYRVRSSMWETLVGMAGDNCAGQLLEWRRQQLQELSSSSTAGGGAQHNVLWVPLPIWGGGMYIVGDAQLQREILADPTTDKNDMYDSFAKTLSGPSVFTRKTSDPHWKVLRRGAAPAFALSHLDRMHRVCERHVEAWIETKQFRQNDVTVIDPSYECIRLTMGIILEGAFEYTNASAEEVNEFLQELGLAVQEFMVIQGLNPLRGLYGRLVHAATRRAHTAADRLRAFARKVLESYRQKKSSSASLSNEKEPVTLIRLIETNPLLSEDDKLSEILTYIIAGHDTTGYTIANTLFLIGKHPTVMEKVAEAQTGHPSTMAPYTQWCLWESCRLEPVVASGAPRITGRDFYARTTGSDHVLRIPANRTVLIAPLLAHHDPVVFTAPEKYQPERWESIASSEQSSLLHLFLSGKRNCIGQSLAKAELEVVLARFLSEFDVQVEQLGVMQEILTWHHHGGSLRVLRRRKTTSSASSHTD